MYSFEKLALLIFSATLVPCLPSPKAEPSANPVQSGGDTSKSNKQPIQGSNTAPSKKKGGAIWPVAHMSEVLTSLGVAWAYSWDEHPSTSFTDFQGSAPKGIELIPMVKLEDNSDTTKIAASSSSAMLGWNEPDNAIDVGQAIGKWPQIVSSIGQKRIGAPAPINVDTVNNNDWFSKFMAGIVANGGKVDFIPLHHYSPFLNDVAGGVQKFKTYVESVHEKYKLPIWITEFAMIDYSVPDQPKYPDQATQIEFMKQACQMLEDLESVERYAWFAVPQSDKDPATYLVDAGGNLNELGKVYAGV